MLAVWGRLLAVVLLAVIGVYAVLLERPPDPAPASAPPADFSADRAVSAVDQLAREPRPIGSPASDAARDALVGRLRAEGLAPRVDVTASLAAEEGQARAARVENVVATLPGTDPTGAVVLMAHYDSVAAGPGAADDMSGVATILETVRALRAGPPLRNDVTVVLTDGEEAGLHGARAWVREQLAPDRPTVVLNWEARGVEGPSLLFQTSPGNAGLVDAWAQSVPYPRGDSSQVEIYRFLPNDTDLSPVLDAGRPGMNAAFIEGAYQYHTPGDVPANLSRASVQNHGGNALALTRALGERDLAPLDPAASGAPATGDRTYFTALGSLVTYDTVWAWPVAGLALLLVVALIVVARVRRKATIARRPRRGAHLPRVSGAAVAAGVGFWAALVAIRPAYADTGPFLGRPLFYEIAVGVLAFAVTTLVVSLLRRRPGGAALCAGALLVLALLVRRAGRRGAGLGVPAGLAGGGARAGSDARPARRRAAVARGAAPGDRRGACGGAADPVRGRVVRRRRGVRRPGRRGVRAGRRADRRRAVRAAAARRGARLRAADPRGRLGADPRRRRPVPRPARRPHPVRQQPRLRRRRRPWRRPVGDGRRGPGAVDPELRGERARSSAPPGPATSPWAPDPRRRCPSPAPSPPCSSGRPPACACC